MENEIRIPIPEGMEIDRENSTFECIKFKPVQKKRWRDNENKIIKGYYISNFSVIRDTEFNNNTPCNYNVFVTEKQAKSALAMARISQIMANDERFGGVVTDEEWANYEMVKYVILRNGYNIYPTAFSTSYNILAFHTAEQRNLFLKENEDLVKDYLMID